MSILVLIIIVLIGLFGYAEVDDPDCVAEDGCVVETVAMAGWTSVDVNGIEGVVVAEENGAEFIPADAYWTPSHADLTAAEDAIAAEYGELEHMRQYVGFIADGIHKIYVNGFCDAFGLDPQSQPVLVEDGGECYFEATYNVDSGELEAFMFNGEA